MFRKKPNSTSSDIELGNYVDGFDVYNSRLLEKLNDPSIVKNSYTITVGQNRPDIIAEDFYGSTTYTGYIILQYSQEDLIIGKELQLISPESLNRVIMETIDEHNRFDD